MIRIAALLFCVVASAPFAARAIACTPGQDPYRMLDAIAAEYASRNSSFSYVIADVSEIKPVAPGLTLIGVKIKKTLFGTATDSFEVIWHHPLVNLETMARPEMSPFIIGLARLRPEQIERAVNAQRLPRSHADYFARLPFVFGGDGPCGSTRAILPLRDIVAGSEEHHSGFLGHLIRRAILTDVLKASP